MAKVVLSSFVADTPATDEQVKSANASAKAHNHETPFPSGHGRLSAHWYLVVDTVTGTVTATTDPAAAYDDDDNDTREAAAS